MSRHSFAGSLPPQMALEMCIFCTLLKRDHIAAQDILYFQCFLADWEDWSLVLCTTVHGLCGTMHQLMLTFDVRSKGQGGVAWYMGHQDWEGERTRSVPQGFVPKIISSQPFAV